MGLVVRMALSVVLGLLGAGTLLEVVGFSHEARRIVVASER